MLFYPFCYKYLDIEYWKVSLKSIFLIIQWFRLINWSNDLQGMGKQVRLKICMVLIRLCVDSCSKMALIFKPLLHSWHKSNIWWLILKYALDTTYSTTYRLHLMMRTSSHVFFVQYELKKIYLIDHIHLTFCNTFAKKS